MALPRSFIGIVLLMFLFTKDGQSALFPIEPRHPLAGKVWPAGSPWPLPRNWTESNNLVTLDPVVFRFISTISPDACPPLDFAIEKYSRDFLFSPKLGPSAPDLSYPMLTEVRLELPSTSNECGDWPRYSDEPTYEQYNLTISIEDSRANAFIRAHTIWGILRGMETFSQLIWNSERASDINPVYFYLNTTDIHDRPRFGHRGLMIDTARHYEPERVIIEIMDAMMYNKMNVLHWHIVDDQSFPFVSTRFPTLSRGAYNYKAIYSPEAVQRVLYGGRVRGIRVILEFDTPGHTHSFGKAFPELLTPCYGDGITPGTPDYPNHAAYENLDPTKNFTYEFMREFFSEVANVTKDNFVHLGMDEVYTPCWESSPEIRRFMEELNYTMISQVQEHYTHRHVDMVKSLGVTPVSWQDPLDAGVELDRDVIIQTWKDWGLTWQEHFQRSLDLGYRSILSSPWYVNYIGYGESWKNYYNVDPILSLPNITDSQEKLVLGGEACIWSEFVDKTNILPRLFPFVSPVAERLWSLPLPLDGDTVNDVRTRLDLHRCRMLLRGIPAQPILNGYCGHWETEN